MTTPTALLVLATKFDELEAKVEIHDKLLVRGDGPNQPSIPERIREMEKVFKEIGFWVRSIGLLILGQFIVATMAGVWFFLRILPALSAMDKTQLGEIAKTLIGGK